MRITVQYFSKTGDRELDGILRKALEAGGFIFIHKLLDKGGGSMDYVFENNKLAEPDEKVTCIDCIQGTFKSRIDNKGRCLVCQQEAVRKIDLTRQVKEVLNEEVGEEANIVRKMVDAYLGDIVTFSYHNRRDEESETSMRKVASRIVSEKPVEEKDINKNIKSPGRLGEDVEL